MYSGGSHGQGNHFSKMKGVFKGKGMILADSYGAYLLFSHLLFLVFFLQDKLKLYHVSK